MSMRILELLILPLAKDQDSEILDFGNCSITGIERDFVDTNTWMLPTVTTDLGMN